MGQAIPFSILARPVDAPNSTADLAGWQCDESDGMLVFRQIVDKLPQCIFWKDAGGSFLGCNANGAHALGLPDPEAISGKTDFDFHHDLTVAEYLRREDFRVMRGGIPIYRQLSRGSGEPETARWYETSKVPLRDRKGAIVGLLISYDDVTERHRAEEGLRASNERLRQAEMRLIELNASLESRIQEAAARAADQERLFLQQSRHAAIGEMVGNIAHQWRQPLTTLSLLLQNVRYDALEGAGDETGLEQRLSQAFSQIDRMSSTIEDFRNFFRPAADDVEFDVCACIDDVLKLMQASLEHAQIEVALHGCENCRVLGRPNELGQVFMNLIGNAKDALVANRSRGRRIWIELAVTDGYVTLRERNNGGCIPPEHLQQIFDPYYTTKTHGTGLGLYMTRKIIAEHFHGTIECSNYADGVEFMIRLPLAAAG